LGIFAELLFELFISVVIFFNKHSFCGSLLVL